MITAITEKVLLSDCKDIIVLDDKESDKYTIAIPNTEYLVIEVGCKVGSGMANFVHPNITASVKRIYEFKHYRKGGSKFWTSQAGISHYLVIPTNKIYILPEKGYSYIHAEINGVKVLFNVSGGSSIGGNGWTDWLSPLTQISVNHKLKDIKKLVEVAVRKELEFQVKELDANDLERWQNMSDKVSRKVINQREKLCKMIEAKEDVMIVLKDHYTQKEGKAVSLQRAGKWSKPDAEGRRTLDFTKGIVKKYIVNFGYNDYRVRPSQIDWVATCKKNFQVKEKVEIEA
jgi:hypothetical protein